MDSIFCPPGSQEALEASQYQGGSHEVCSELAQKAAQLVLEKERTTKLQNEKPIMRPGPDVVISFRPGAPKPANEEARVQVLRSFNIFKAPSNPRFDQLTTLASMIWKVPVAIISLADKDDHIFKSCVGFSTDRVSREDSICAFVLLPDIEPVLVVHDLTKDNRFKNSPLVAGPPHLRFYAGAPIVTSTGWTLGGICVADYVPRKFSAQDSGLLQAIASLAVQEIEKDEYAAELQRLQTERFEQDKRGLLQAIDAFSEGLVLCDVSEPNQPIVFVNKGFEHITGYSLQDCIGKQCGALLQGADSCASSRGTLREAIQKNESASVEILNYRKDGTPFWNFVRVRPVEAPLALRGEGTEGTSSTDRRYYFGIISDITALKEKEAELERIRLAELEAQASAKAKRTFLANISHEIRTPMNAIIACSQMQLEAQNVPPEWRELASMIHGSGQQLLSLLNDILDFSKLEAGKMDPQAVYFDLWTCLDACVEMLAVKYQLKGLDLHVNIDDSIPRYICADEVYLKRILVNLLSNALKFTEEGGEVELSVHTTSSAPSGANGTWEVTPRTVLGPAGSSWCDSDSEHTPRDTPACERPLVASPSVPQGSASEDSAESSPLYDLVFSLRDTGIGISEKDQEALFQPFHQLNSSRTKKNEGTGLGLMISKQLVESMGGRMWLHSRQGHGSTFSFHLPCACSFQDSVLSSPTTPLPQQQPSIAVLDSLRIETEANRSTDLFQGRRALVVAGNECFERTAVSMLAAAGVAADVARSLASAVEQLAGAAFDVVVTDEEADWARGLLPVVAVRAKTSATWHREAQCSSSGRVVCLLKPLRSSQLHAALVELWGREERSSEGSVAQGALTSSGDGRLEREPVESSGRRREKLRILVAEDNRMNQKVLVRLLKLLSHDCEAVVSNGLQVVERLRKERFDVILMDLQMPDCDGLEATSRLRKLLPEEEQPFVVALTAEVGPGVEEECQQAGMSAYLSKPLQKDELALLLAHIEKLVQEGIGQPRNVGWFSIHNK